MPSKTFQEICRCPRVCQLIVLLSEVGEAYAQQIEDHGVSRGTVYRMVHAAEKYGLIDSRFDVSSGAVRKYYSLTEKGKRQAKIIKACNEHLLSP